MPAPFKPSVLTANDLIDGEVVYYTQDGWGHALKDAYVFTAQEAAQVALESVDDNQVVGAYLALVNVIDGTPSPAHFREAFRATGPSNYKHGKQENVSV